MHVVAAGASGTTDAAGSLDWDFAIPADCASALIVTAEANTGRAIDLNTPLTGAGGELRLTGANNGVVFLTDGPTNQNPVTLEVDDLTISKATVNDTIAFTSGIRVSGAMGTLAFQFPDTYSIAGPSAIAVTTAGTGLPCELARRPCADLGKPETLFAGVAAIYPPGTNIPEAAREILQLLGARHVEPVG